MTSAKKIDLMKFCIDEQLSHQKWPGFIRPWSIGRKAYASDSAMLIRCNKNVAKPFTPSDERVPPKPDEVVPDMSAAKVWLAIAKVDLCPKCRTRNYRGAADDTCCIVEVFGRSYQGFYLRKIASLPNALIADVAGRLVFKFKGGDGALMDTKDGRCT